MKILNCAFALLFVVWGLRMGLAGWSLLCNVFEHVIPTFNPPDSNSASNDALKRCMVVSVVTPKDDSLCPKTTHLKRDEGESANPCKCLFFLPLEEVRGYFL